MLATNGCRAVLSGCPLGQPLAGLPSAGVTRNLVENRWLTYAKIDNGGPLRILIKPFRTEMNQYGGLDREPEKPREQTPQFARQ